MKPKRLREINTIRWIRKHTIKDKIKKIKSTLTWQIHWRHEGSGWSPLVDETIEQRNRIESIIKNRKSIDQKWLRIKMEINDI